MCIFIADSSSGACCAISVKLSVLKDDTEFQFAGLGADFVQRNSRVGVLGGEHGFARFNEGEHLLAPTLGKTILCQRPIEIGL